MSSFDDAIGLGAEKALRDAAENMQVQRGRVQPSFTQAAPHYLVVL